MKDLENINHDTRERYLICASQDDHSDPDGIRMVEGRIIKAAIKLPTFNLFRYMTNNQSSHSFRDRWTMLQRLKWEWGSWRDAWEELATQRGDLIARRDWKKDKGMLEKIYGAFIVSRPGGFEEDLECTRDYRGDSGLTAAAQTPCADTDSKGKNPKGTDSKGTDSKGTQEPTSTEMPPPPYTSVAPDTPEPTFGYSYRRLIQNLRDLVDLTHLGGDIGTNIISQETSNKILKKEHDIKQYIDSLQNHTFFAHMSSRWTGIHLISTVVNFGRGWKRLKKVSTKWEPPFALAIDSSDWQKDRDVLQSFISNCGKAKPLEFKEHPDWTEDFCASCCLTTTGGEHRPWRRLHGYTLDEALQTTFGGAWRRLDQDLDNLRHLINPKALRDSDVASWQLILDLQGRIIQNVNVIPKHPLFKHMGKHASKDLFAAEWESLKNLSGSWEDSRSTWREPLNKHEVDRHWGSDSYVLEAKLNLGHPRPIGYENSLEWTQNSLPADELMKWDWLLDSRPKTIASGGSIVRTSTL